MKSVMKLYHIWQTDNNDYDTYDSAIVAALSPKIAKNINPNSGHLMDWNNYDYRWCSSVDEVYVEYIGIAKRGIKQGVICASFNAG